MQDSCDKEKLVSLFESTQCWNEKNNAEYGLSQVSLPHL